MTPSRTGEQSLAAWYDEHRGIFARIAHVYARSPSDVAELEEEMLYQLWTSLPRFTGQAKPSTWVYRVCLNTALTWQRSARRRAGRIEPDSDLSRIATGEASPAATAEQRDWLSRLYGALHQLPPSERALVLLMLEGLTHREIGEITGMTENHVAVALLRTRRRLATLMKGVTDELG